MRRHGRRLRCWPARVLLGEGIGDVLRIDRLTPADLAEVKELLPAEIAEAAATHRLAEPTRVRHTLDFQLGTAELDATSTEAVFRGADGRTVTLTLRDGAVDVR